MDPISLRAILILILVLFWFPGCRRGTDETIVKNYSGGYEVAAIISWKPSVTEKSFTDALRDYVVQRFELDRDDIAIYHDYTTGWVAISAPKSVHRALAANLPLVAIPTDISTNNSVSDPFAEKRD